MKRGSFIFDGVSSESVNALIQNRPVIEAPLRKVEWTSPYGVDGDTPFDEGAYNNTELSLYMLTDGVNAIADRQALYNLIDTRGVYKEFIPYFDPDKIYRVMLKSKVQFESPYFFREKQSLSATFTVKPYKHLVDNDPITLNGTNGVTGQVINPTNDVSQPIIKVVGTGPATLTVNGEDFSIINVSNHITLNSERYIAYQEDASGILLPMNDKIGSREYPVFKPGVNNISVTGAVTQLYIEPRWRSLV
jgi:phage-related protein